MFDSLFQTLNHLPVTKIADNVADHFVNQMIPVVTSAVASGKTMLIPAHCAARLADDPVDPVVYVLEPTRFLANNAAESLRSLLGPHSENLVGCINSSRSDDDSIVHADNRIIFTTVGYALSSGILKKCHNFLLDEAHETSIELSLTKAYLHHRLEQGDLINVGVLSATIDVTNEMKYWGDAATHFETEGSAYPVEFLHNPAFSLDEAVITLIEDHGRTGILVFVSGVEEIEEAIDKIRHRLESRNIDFEIEGIHGNSTGEVRKRASRMRQKAVKILVGTNVLESGVSLPWVNGGVSSGDTKVMHVSGNVRKLNKEELPRWRIHQEMGRCGRFEPGVFILAHKTPLLARPDMSAPDIVRLPLTELVMQCTNFPDIHIHDLKFTERESPDPQKVNEAIQALVEYGLIEEKDTGQIVLTDEGRMIQQLPLSYRAAAAYCEAHRLGMVAEFLPFITMLDIGDMRHIYRNPMNGVEATDSDPLFQLKVITRYFYNWREMNYRERQETAEAVNVNLKKFNEFNLLLGDLERKTGIRANFAPYLPTPTDATPDKEFHRHLKQVAFRSMIRETYPYMMFGGSVKIPIINVVGGIFGSATLSNTTNCQIETDDDNGIAMCAGNVRVVTPKFGRPFAVLETVTVFNKDDMRHLIKRFGRSTIQRIANISQMPTELSNWLGGAQEKSIEALMAERYKFDGGIDALFSPRNLAPRGRVNDEPKPVVTAAAERTGTLGDILSAALKRK